MTAGVQRRRAGATRRVAIALARGAYALSLLAYPASFRRELGGAMREAFADLCRHAWRSGPLPFAARATRSLLDSLFNGLAERLQADHRPRHTAPGSPRSPRRRFPMSSLLDDARRAARRLQRAPVFTICVVLTIAIGVGAFISVYSILDNVLWESMPYREPERLAYVWRDYTWADFPRGWVGGVDILAMRERVDAFEGVAALRRGSLNLSSRDGGDPAEVQVLLSTANFFDLLGVEPAMGRGFTAGEDVEGAPLVVVLGHELWQQRYGGDPDIVGRTIYMDNEPAEVIGVMPESFHFVMNASLTAPSSGDAYINLRWNLAEETDGSLAGLVRVREGVGPAVVRAQLDAAVEPLDREIFGGNGLRLWAAYMHEDLVKDVRPALLALAGAATFMLLILCVNLATLLLGRASRRSRELAVSAALGANRLALLRDCMAESLLLTLSGGLLGLLVARLGTGLIARAATDLPLRYAVGVDGSVTLTALAAAALLGILAGTAPAVRATRTDVAVALRAGGGRVTGGRAPGAMVMAQVALSLILLVGAGVLARSLMYLMRSDPGFDGRGVLTARMPVTPDDYPETADLMNYYGAIRERIGGLPGVTAVALTNALPLTTGTSQSAVLFPGSPANTGNEQEDALLVDYFRVTPGYFDTLQIPMFAGRDFNAGDHDQSTPVAIIDDTLARRYFPDGEVLGQTMMFFGREHSVIGVVDQARLYDIHADDRSQVYVPVAQRPTHGVSLAVRTGRAPAALAGEVQRAVRAIEPDQPLTDFRTMDQVTAESLNGERLSLGLIAGFAFGALLLATLGLYGVVSNAVSSRTREMGLRMALGADGARVRALVVRQGMRLVLAGMVAGLLGSIATARLLESLVVGVAPTDPVAIVLAALGLSAATFMACWLPARRASAVDPQIALRAD